MSLIGQNIIFLKEFACRPGMANNGSRDWRSDYFSGEVLDKHKEYYLVKMDKESFAKYNKIRKEENDSRRIYGPIFRVYYENIRDLVESELDNVLK